MPSLRKKTSVAEGVQPNGTAANQDGEARRSTSDSSIDAGSPNRLHARALASTPTHGDRAASPRPGVGKAISGPAHSAQRALHVLVCARTAKRHSFKSPRRYESFNPRMRIGRDRCAVRRFSQSQAGRLGRTRGHPSSRRVRSSSDRNGATFAMELLTFASTSCAKEALLSRSTIGSGMP